MGRPVHRFYPLIALAVITLLVSTAQADESPRATRLYDAIAQNKPKAVQHFLQDATLANTWFHRGTTPLHVAAEKGNPQIVAILIEKGADLMRLNKNLETAQDIALRNGHNFVAAQICYALPEPEQFDNLMYVLDALVRYDSTEHFPLFRNRIPEERTIEYHEMDFLFLAASCGSTTMLRFLLDEGRDLEERDSLSQWTVLHHLASRGHLGLIQTVYGDRDDIDSVDGSGQTPLAVAVASGHEDVAAYLIARGADVNAADQYGNTPLHIAARWDRPRCAEVLVQSGAHSASRNTSGLFPLDVALERGRENLVAVFPVDAPAKRFGETPEEAHWIRLKNAIVDGKVGQTQSLLNKSAAGIDQIDHQGQGLIHYACTNGNPQLVQVLAAAGADVNLLDALSGWSPLMMSVVSGQVDTVNAILVSGADVNHQDIRGWTALHVAHFYGIPEIIQAIEGADPDTSLVNDDGQTADALSHSRSAALAASAERQ